MALLDRIEAPEDVKNLPADKIPALMDEVRERIIDVTLANGGHMASSLGAVELITALLRTFDPSHDRIVFDVGHQAYAWKILTGRNSKFDTLRKEGGVSGYLKRGESPYDHFGAGHSSTSLSAALGYAVARDLRGESYHVAAVIGDGALINGESFEALNHAGSLDTPVIFILNDNEMAISPRVGGIAMHLARLSTSALYRTTKNVVKEFCRSVVRSEDVYEALRRAKNGLKRAVTHGNLFNDMGLTYWGPFDGHDEEELERVFELAKQYDGPLLIHLITKKGKGYLPAEQNPVKYHGLPAGSQHADAVTWSRGAAACIEELAKDDPRIVVLTPAMTEGSALTHFKELYPERFFDVGIAEEHMMTFAAGLAAGGMKPIACYYSTFLQRAVDQLVHDVCLQKLPVVIAVDRAGFVGDDGETHQGLFEMNWVSSVPNLEILTPYDLRSLRAAFKEAIKRDGPVLIRYPRGAAVESLEPIPPAVGTDWAIVALGTTAEVALDAAKLAAERGLPVPDVIPLDRIQPLPEGLLERLQGKKLAFCLEEAYRRGGLGEHLAATCAERGMRVKVVPIAVDAHFVAQGTQAQQRARYGLNPETIVRRYEHEGTEDTA